MKKTIVVTQDDIDKGDRRSHKYCPIARAMRRELGQRIDVTEYDWYTMGGDRHPLPMRAQNFIARYDADMEVGPIEFTVTVED